MKSLLFAAVLLVVLLDKVSARTHFHSRHNSYERQEMLLKNFKRVDAVEDMIAQVSQTNMRAYLDYVTGVTSNHLTRHSGSNDSYTSIVEYVIGIFRSFGLNCRIESIGTFGLGPNAFCELPGVSPGPTGQTVILSAHLDSRVEDINDVVSAAPGGNDNASGVVALIEIARVIQRTGARFNLNILFCLFTGGKLELAGSSYFAPRVTNDVVVVINADELAYKDPEQELPRLDFARIDTDPNLRAFASLFIQPYVPQSVLTIGDGHDDCCSDNQPFHNANFSSISFTQGFGFDIDTARNTEDDVVERKFFSLEQLARITEALIAFVSTQASVVGS